MHFAVLNRVVRREGGPGTSTGAVMFNEKQTLLV